MGDEAAAATKARRTSGGSRPAASSVDPVKRVEMLLKEIDEYEAAEVMFEETIDLLERQSVKNKNTIATLSKRVADAESELASIKGGGTPNGNDLSMRAELDEARTKNVALGEEAKKLREANAELQTALNAALSKLEAKGVTIASLDAADNLPIHVALLKRDLEAAQAALRSREDQEDSAVASLRESLYQAEAANAKLREEVTGLRGRLGMSPLPPAPESRLAREENGTKPRSNNLTASNAGAANKGEGLGVSNDAGGAAAGAGGLNSSAATMTIAKLNGSGTSSQTDSAPVTPTGFSVEPVTPAKRTTPATPSRKAAATPGAVNPFSIRDPLHANVRPTGWGDMHREVLLNVFSMLDVDTLCKLMLVCKRWRDELIHHDRNWPNRLSKIKWTDVSLRKIPKELITQATRIRVNTNQFTDRGLKYLGEKGCMNLRQINLSVCRAITDQGIVYLIAGCTAIRNLNLGATLHITDLGIKYLAAACNQLQVLDLHDCSHLTNTAMHHLSVGCPDVRILLLNDCPNLGDDGVAFLANSPMSKELHQLGLGGCRKLTDAAMDVIADHCTALKQLDISRLPLVSDFSMFALGRIQGLAELDISRCPLITDSGLQTLSLVGSLKHINISGLSKNSNITEAGLRCFAGNVVKLG